MSNFTKSSVHVNYGRGSVFLTTVQCVMYFRFCGWRHVFTKGGQWVKVTHTALGLCVDEFGRWRHLGRSCCLLFTLQACS